MQEKLENGKEQYVKRRVVAGEKDHTPARVVTTYAVAKAVSRFSELNPPGLRGEAAIKESDRILKEKIRRFWDIIAVQGVKGYEAKSGKRELRPHSDPDGKFATNLMEKAGILDLNTHEITHITSEGKGRLRKEGRLGSPVKKRVLYIPAGNLQPGVPNIDTGYGRGVEYRRITKSKDDQGGGEPTLVFDDHDLKEKNNSATKATYIALKESGLLDEAAEHDKDFYKITEQVVDLITHQDNGTWPARFTNFSKSDRTIYGLIWYLDFGRVYAMFKEGIKPDDELTDEQIKKYNLEKAYTNRKTAVEESLKRVEKLKKLGCVFESNYGKVLVDPSKNNPQKKVRLGYEGAGAGAGTNVYVRWDPPNGFFISINDGQFPEDFLSQGKVIKGHLVVYDPDEHGPMKLKLKEVLDKLGVDTENVSPHMKEFLYA